MLDEVQARCHLHLKAALDGLQVESGAFGELVHPIPQSADVNPEALCASLQMEAFLRQRESRLQQMLAAREEAIIQNANRLLAEKGFDAMTVDEVASAVGIAKASLYKHFPSKEDLAAAAMVRVMRRAQQFLAGIDATLPVQQKLEAVVRWMLQVQLAGQMPSLPSQNSSLRSAPGLSSFTRWRPDERRWRCSGVVFASFLPSM